MKEVISYFAVAAGVALAAMAALKLAQVAGPMGLRRAYLVVELVFLAAFIACLVLVFWEHSWWQGVLCALTFGGGLSLQWNDDRFGRFTSAWRGEDESE